MVDVLIIGGGPAGSAMGSYLSMAGIQNTIIEGAVFPRPHVGESMVTASTRVFEEIGFLPTMEREGFPRKYGASWHPPKGREFAILFGEFAQPGIKQDYTYHVDRSKFDLLMLKHAEKLGSKVMQGVYVKRVLHDDNGYAVGVRAQIADQEIDIPARMVVDASGRNTLLGRQLGMKIKDPIFNQYAVHTWFEDLDRGKDETKDFIHIYFLPVERGWVWQIPITDKITSVGVVTEKDVFKEARLDLESYFYKYATTNPDMAAALQNARRVSDWKTEGDYSYSLKKYVGNGQVMIGDAARFVDPIFSSGVSIALYSAKFASERIRIAFETGDFSEATFAPYEEKLRGGADVWYEFIRLYYKLLPLFTHFIQSRDHRLQVLQLLQGEVYDRQEVPVLDAMRNYIAKVEASEGHLFKAHLMDIPIAPGAV